MFQCQCYSLVQFWVPGCNYSWRGSCEVHVRPKIWKFRLVCLAPAQFWPKTPTDIWRFEWSQTRICTHLVWARRVQVWGHGHYDITKVLWNQESSILLSQDSSYVWTWIYFFKFWAHVDSSLAITARTRTGTRPQHWYVLSHCGYKFG